MGGNISMEDDVEDLIRMNGGFRYQVAMSNRIFSENIPESELPCMNCLRVEMGERACYSGICDSCGKTPPSLRWKFPELQNNTRASRTATGSGSRARSSSDARERQRSNGQLHSRRRLSISTPSSTGLSASRVDLSSFTHTYSKIVGVDSEGCTNDSTRCVICLGDFLGGDRVRRLACMHLFHVKCVDSWLTIHRECPVCRVDIEASAAQFR